VRLCTGASNRGLVVPHLCSLNSPGTLFEPPPCDHLQAPGALARPAALPRARSDGNETNAEDLASREASGNPFVRFDAWREQQEVDQLRATVASCEVRLPDLQQAAAAILAAASEESAALEAQQAAEVAALEAESPSAAVDEARLVVAERSYALELVLSETEALRVG